MAFVQVCFRSKEYTENFEWDSGELLWKHNDKTFFSFGDLGGWVIQVVDNGHQPCGEPVKRILAVLVQE